MHPMRVPDQAPARARRDIDRSRAVTPCELDVAALAARDSAAPVPSVCPHVEKVREELARELHDVVAQRLNVAVVELELLRRQETGAVAERATRLQRHAREALEGIRAVISGLRVDPAAGAAFVDSIKQLLAEFGAETGIVTGLELHAWPDSVPAVVALHARRIIEEALCNVRRHSGASRVDVFLQGANGMLEVTLHDDGRAVARQRSGGFGIRGMQERAALLGGGLRVEIEPGCGTTVRGLFPGGCAA
jgi:signal transduction histidine kinase